MDDRELLEEARRVMARLMRHFTAAEVLDRCARDRQLSQEEQEIRAGWAWLRKMEEREAPQALKDAQSLGRAGSWITRGLERGGRDG